MTDIEELVAGMAPEEVFRLLKVAESYAGGDALQAFIPRISPGWVSPRHLTQVTDAFARSRIEPVKICLSLPPRHAKTETISHGCAYLMEQDDGPNLKIVYSTYESALALEKSREIQTYAMRAGIPMKSRQAANMWKTDKGSVFYATGVGGPLTGRGARVLIIDDPIKNREEAESPTIREKIWGWFTSTAYTRVEPGGSTIIVHTRWHKDDLIGRIERGDAGDGWEIINIPAISDTGVVLWPELRDQKYLEDIRRVIGEYDWASLYLGQPRPKGAALFSDNPARFVSHDPDDGWTYLVSVDPAATEKTSADYSVIMVVANKGKPGTISHEMQVLEVQRGQWRTPDLAKRVLATCQDWGAPALVEAVAGFKAVPQMLRDLDRRLKIYEMTPAVDKFIRATPVAAAWTDNRVKLPTKGPWVKPLIVEAAQFTGVADARDDQVDALSQGWNAYAATQQLQRGVFVPGWKEIF